MRIFILEDNVILSKQIKTFLELKGYFVENDFDPERAMQKILDEHFDVLVLDINLPKMDWLEFCQKLRSKWMNIWILMLTSRTTKQDVVKWLEIWADDYLGKPFDYDELNARINALYRRDSNNKSDSIKVLDIEIDFQKRKVMKKTKEIALSTLEFDLLAFLVKNQWEPQSRRDIFENVWWKFDDYMFSRNVDVYIWLLRKKLWDKLIKTIKWFWYVIE